jgi:hypothetical protein
VAANPGRQKNHVGVCAAAIVGGLVFALIGFFMIGGAIGATVGGAGIGAGVMGLRGAISGQTPRLF